ncbi:copper resistance protein CopC [Methylocystis sp. WRRC1]|uniref:copper resistance CopC family protein n=1 Tax=Methylocystis sp. WRRC1 TaxID=1732014 RepID=UPI001D15C25F|nr:copper resistance CopC family protein [Methylocystis sp. WRRC1]MCC3244136.1 copper resistance protein CopC [Methylocystis sp. WRRC1]
MMKFVPTLRGIIASKLLVAGAVAMSMAGSPAFAHSFLVEATPSSKDHVATSPKTVKLRFGGGVEPAYSKLTIEGADGKVLATGAIGVPDKPRELSVESPELAPGKYVVRYRVLSTDGHIVEGNYEFTVDPK